MRAGRRIPTVCHPPCGPREFYPCCLERTPGCCIHAASILGILRWLLRSAQDFACALRRAHNGSTSTPRSSAWFGKSSGGAQDDRRQRAFFNAHFSNHKQSILTLKPVYGSCVSFGNSPPV